MTTFYKQMVKNVRTRALFQGGSVGMCLFSILATSKPVVVIIGLILIGWGIWLIVKDSQFQNYLLNQLKEPE